MHHWRGLDGPTLAQQVAETADEYRKNGELVTVNVDVIGVGSSPYDALNSARYRSSIRAVPVNVAEVPTVNDHYARLRDQIWFELARWLQHGAIPDDAKLVGELTCPTYSFDIKGNRKVEAKEPIKARLGRSPDRADALALAVFTSARPETTAQLWLRADLFG
jgi:hypothetical protein